MKRMVCCLLLMIALMFYMFTVMTFAQGTDDGVVCFTTKNDKEYLGAKQSNFCIKFDAANGDNNEFYRYSNADVNSNNITDICDLVALNNAIVENGESIDFNFDSILDDKDLLVVRQFILGTTDFEIK